MEKHGYKDLAKIYDLVYQKKDYKKETEFIKSLFKSKRTILDVGCGTGNHMKILEGSGFLCDGIDLNQEMLDIARIKLRGNLTKADMRDFNLNKKYDGIICMFAAFNHLLNMGDAKKTISNFKKHLNEDGLILIDLHNPQASGRKEFTTEDIKRKIEWDYNPKTKIEKSDVTFTIDNKEIKDSHTMRIYSIEEMTKLLESNGFSEIKVFENYKFSPGTSKSENLEIFARFSS